MAGSKRIGASRTQMADLKVTIKGAAKVDFEVKERRDGSLLVKYISHMSGDVTVSLVRVSLPSLRREAARPARLAEVGSGAAAPSRRSAR